MPKILIVDDDAPVRKMLRRILEGQGYEVLDAPNDDEGLELFNRQSPDLVITDIFMPRKGGIEMIRRLKEDYPLSKIIAISGGCFVGPDTYLNLARAVGAERTLTKPIEKETLLNAVRTLI